MKTEITRKDVTEYIEKAVTGLSESVAADGGNLITRYVAAEIINKAFYESQVAKDCTAYTYTGGGDGLKVPYSTSPLTNALSSTEGIRAYWISEASQKVPSYPQLGQADIGFSKLVVRVPITDELRSDSSMVYDLVLAQGAGALSYKMDYEILRGDGSISTLLGVASGAGNVGTVFVNVASASPVTNVSQLSSMMNVLHPQAHAKAKWYVSPQSYMTLATIDEDFKTWGNDGQLYVFGKPVVSVPQLDTLSGYTSAHLMPNNIVLADLSRYVIVQRPPQIKESSDFRFEYDESEIRMVLRIGGQMASETMTLDDGVTYGWAVIPQYAL